MLFEEEAINKRKIIKLSNFQKEDKKKMVVFMVIFIFARFMLLLLQSVIGLSPTLYINPFQSEIGHGKDDGISMKRQISKGKTNNRAVPRIKRKNRKVTQ